MSIADDLFEDVPVEEQSEPRYHSTNGAHESPFKMANALKTAEICDRLGMEHDGARATCPGCGEPGAAIALARPGLKCLHARCADKGKRGFRTNIDLVMEVKHLSSTDAVNLLGNWFGFDGVKRKDTNGTTTGAKKGAAHEPAAGQESPQTIELVRLESLFAPALERAARRRAGDEKPVPIPFGEYAEILGGGFWPGAHFVVAGPGAGKSQKTVQAALAAVLAGVPVTYIGLELDEAQIAMRVLGAHGHFSWSGLYLGRCSDSTVERAGAAAQALTGVPFYADFGPPRGWPASRLVGIAEAMRKAHPAGPMLIVLDYLQLVGDEPREFERRPDIRERIGGAAYAARDVARRFDAAVLVVSSAARAHYSLLANAAGEAGLSTTNAGLGGKIKTIAYPHVLLGLGKESGEVEFSADTVTVLAKWPSPLENGSTAVLCTVPKVRWGKERWCALAFDGGRFDSLRIDTLGELPELPEPAGRATKHGGGRRKVAAAALVDRLVATLLRIGPSTRTTLVKETKGNDESKFEAIEAAIKAERIIEGGGILRAPPGMGTAE